MKAGMLITHILVVSARTSLFLFQMATLVVSMTHAISAWFRKMVGVRKCRRRHTFEA